MERTRSKKILSIVLNSLLYVFMFICLVSIVLVTTSKKNGDDAINLFGHQMRRIISPSMDECEHTDVSEYEIKSLPVDTMIFIETVPEDLEEQKAWYDSLKVGDVLTFKYLFVRQEVITHRIIDIKDNGKGGYYIYLRGDNVNTPEGGMTQLIDTSDEMSPNYVLGKVEGKSKFIGNVVAVLSSTAGMVFLIIVPIILIIIFEVYKLVRLLTQDKKRVQKENAKAQLDEIEKLKRKIEQLEKEKNNEG